MKVFNSNNYFNYVTRILVILTIAVFIAIIIYPSSFAISFILYLVLIILFTGSRYTQSISIDSQNIIITYFQFFAKKELKISIKEITIKMIKAVAFRNPKYFILQVYQKNKKIYSIDSRDGFLEEDFKKIEVHFHNGFSNSPETFTN